MLFNTLTGMQSCGDMKASYVLQQFESWADLWPHSWPGGKVSRVVSLEPSLNDWVSCCLAEHLRAAAWLMAQQRLLLLLLLLQILLLLILQILILLHSGWSGVSQTRAQAPAWQDCPWVGAQACAQARAQAHAWQTHNLASAHYLMAQPDDLAAAHYQLEHAVQMT